MKHIFHLFSYCNKNNLTKFTKQITSQIKHLLCQIYPFTQSSFKVGVYKRNDSPQNHFQNINLNGHYIYKIIHLVNCFFIRFIFTFLKLKQWQFFMIWMIKHVLKCFERWLRTYVLLCRTIEKHSTGLAISIQIIPILI